MSGAANLFNVGLVFIVELLFALITAYNFIEIFTPKSELTIMKKKETGLVLRAG